MRPLFLLGSMLVVLTAAGPVDERTALINALRTSDDASETFQRNSVLEQTILDLLESFRETMVNGSDDIPVLDPLEVSQLDVDGEDFGVSGVTLSARDIVVNDLSTFQVDSLEVSAWLIVNTVTFNATIPSIEIIADMYDFVADILGFNIFGSGSANLKFLNPRLHGSIVASISIFGGQTVSITSADLHVELAGFEPEITGLFGDENASEFANSFLKYFVPEVVFLYQNEISEYLNEIVPDILNPILADIL